MTTFVPEALLNVRLMSGVSIAVLGAIFLFAAGGRHQSHTRWLTFSAITFGLLQCASQIAVYLGLLGFRTQLVLVAALSVPSMSAMAVGLKEYFDPGSTRPLRAFVVLTLVCLVLLALLLWLTRFWAYSGALVIAIVASLMAMWLLHRWTIERWWGQIVMAALLAGIPATVWLSLATGLSLYDYRQLVIYPASLLYVGVLMLLVIHDATTLQLELRRREKVEVELRALADSLEDQVADRTRSLTAVIDGLRSFAGIVSHDLRAPLRNAGGLASAAREALRQGDTAEADALLVRVVRESLRGAEMVQDLLNLSLVEQAPLKREPTDLEVLVRDVVACLQQQYPEAGRVIEIGPLPTVPVDPSLMRHLVTNLLGNALKFGAGRAGLQIRVAAEVEGSFVRLRVSDNGPGFDPAHKDRLFQAFERLVPRHVEGSGLGLAIVRRVAERHGGSVGVDATHGGGATFWWTLPLH